MKRGERGDGSGLILLVGQAEPAVVCVQNGDIYFAAVCQIAHHRRQQALGLHLVCRERGEEIGKVPLHNGQNILMIAPEIHGNKGVGREDGAVLGLGRVADAAVGHDLDLVCLPDAGEQPVIDHANSARDGTEGADGVFQPVGDHGGVLSRVQLFKLLGHDAEGLGAVVIVGVHDGKGRFYAVCRAYDGVDRAEGLGARLELGSAFGEAVEGLKGVVNLDTGALLNAVSEHFADIVVYIGLDYEHYPVEAGADRVVYGVFHKDLAVGAEALYLLNSAVARAKPGCHDNNGLVHIFLLSVRLFY